MTRISLTAKLLLAIGLSLLVVIGLGIASLWRNDLPADYVIQKYSNAESQFLLLDDGSRIHYRDSGQADGPVIVMIHGSNSSLHTWDGWVQRLGNTYRMLRLDLPGHGLTGDVPQHGATAQAMAETVAQFLQKLDIEGVILAGNSMGGNVAMEFALAHPEQTQAMILVSTSGLVRDSEDTSVGLFRLAQNPILRPVLARLTPRRGVANTLRQSVASPDIFVTDAMIDRYYELLLHKGNRTYSLRRYATQPRSLDDQLSKLNLPVLILWGEGDALIDVKYATRLQQLIAYSELVIYPNVGHIAMEELPATTAQDVRSFLRRRLPTS